jgi:hypothetical protein
MVYGNISIAFLIFRVIIYSKECLLRPVLGSLQKMVSAGRRVTRILMEIENKKE